MRGRGENVEGSGRGEKKNGQGRRLKGQEKKREDGGRGGEETKEAIHNVSCMYMYVAS